MFRNFEKNFLSNRNTAHSPTKLLMNVGFGERGSGMAGSMPEAI